MVPLSSLWPAVVLSGVAVFGVSSLVHMVFQYHTHDFGKIPDEDRALLAIRDAGVPPGSYRFPFAGTMKEMGAPEMKAKLARPIHEEFAPRRASRGAAASESLTGLPRPLCGLLLTRLAQAAPRTPPCVASGGSRRGRAVVARTRVLTASAPRPTRDPRRLPRTPHEWLGLDRGPIGFLLVMPPGGCNMGASLAQWFGLTIAVSAIVACLAGLALGPGATGAEVFRFTASAAVLGYCLMPLTDSIWKGMRWSVSLKFVLDGVLYALATGAVFAWFWPSS